MIVFDPPMRTTRRPRRIPSVAAVVRALGTVQITDRPLDWAASSPAATERWHGGSASPARSGRRPAGSPPRAR